MAPSLLANVCGRGRTLSTLRFQYNSRFSRDISVWNVASLINVVEMFPSANALSPTLRCNITTEWTRKAPSPFEMQYIGWSCPRISPSPPVPPSPPGPPLPPPSPLSSPSLSPGVQPPPLQPPSPLPPLPPTSRAPAPSLVTNSTASDLRGEGGDPTSGGGAAHVGWLVIAGIVVLAIVVLVVLVLLCRHSTRCREEAVAIVSVRRGESDGSTTKTAQTAKEIEVPGAAECAADNVEEGKI